MLPSIITRKMSLAVAVLSQLGMSNWKRNVAMPTGITTERETEATSSAETVPPNHAQYVPPCGPVPPPVPQSAVLHTGEPNTTELSVHPPPNGPLSNPGFTVRMFVIVQLVQPAVL